MRIFLAGSTGAVGRRLVPVLVGEGHEVYAMVRTPDRTPAVEASGAVALVGDGLDGDSVRRAVAQARPEVVVHHMTALKRVGNPRNFDRDFATTNRLRTEGTRHLLAAARAAGARRLIAQSFAGWPFAREGGPVKDEDAPLDPRPQRGQRRSLAAIRELEAMVVGGDGVEGVVLRLGPLYGPGTSLGPGGEYVELVRRRRFPIVGSGAGVWSFCHVDDAVGATVAALERGDPGVFHVVDDDPAPVSRWLPELARTLGAPAPRRVPRWLGLLAVGGVGVSVMTEVRGAANAKARRELAWTPSRPSWRGGFAELADAAVRAPAPAGTS